MTTHPPSRAAERLAIAHFRRAMPFIDACRPVAAALAGCATLGALAAPAQVCTPPIAATATTGVTPTVGTGTPQSCTEAALVAAVAANSVITFNCGSAPATIAVTSTIVLPTDRNLVIDGGGKVTLDGGGRVRILDLERENFRTSSLGLTLQHITLANGKAVGTRYVAPSTSNASCAYGWADGSGGAIYVRDAVLHAIDVSFKDNAAETPGPDVGGGAIYALGSLDVTVVGSTFDGNSGANGGAIGLLNTNGHFVNDLFENNKASGTGANYLYGAASGCPGVAQANQGGAGGNGGAIAIDGGSDTAQTTCGSTFLDNAAGAFGGALFRTADATAQPTSFDRSLFQGNQAKTAGALYVQNAKPLAITASTFATNTATVAGAGQFVSSTLNLLNSTFAGNEATKGLGGALMSSSGDAAGWIRSVTFSGNKSSGGSGYFSAAIFGANFPIYDTVFANDTTEDAGSPMQCGFTPLAGANDMQWPRNHVVGTAADIACVSGITFADPLLGTLTAFGGGPTPTFVPATNSPLRGAGANCPATDQRGFARNTAKCTIGAVE